jgi:uncharacterized protein
MTLEGLRFGFAGPWRIVVTERDGRPLLALLLAIGLAAAAALPLLAAAPDELIGAHAPIGVGMMLGAFAFGLCMQLVLGCGSGTLVNAGSGNLVGAVALATFVAGSFLATLNLGWWASLGSLPVLTLQGLLGTAGGLAVTLAGLAAVAAGVVARAAPGKRLPVPRLVVAALRWQSWLAVAAAGLVLGYTGRIAYGCNVGAFFFGISTGSLHGWAWFAAAFAGSTLGIRLRPMLLHPPVRPPLVGADAR